MICSEENDAYMYKHTVYSLFLTLAPHTQQNSQIHVKPISLNTHWKSGQSPQAVWSKICEYKNICCSHPAHTLFTNLTELARLLQKLIVILFLR